MSRTNKGKTLAFSQSRFLQSATSPLTADGNGDAAGNLPTGPPFPVATREPRFDDAIEASVRHSRGVVATLGDQDLPERGRFSRRKFVALAAVGAAGALALLLVRRGVLSLSSKKRGGPPDVAREDSIFKPRDPQA